MHLDFSSSVPSQVETQVESVSPSSSLTTSSSSVVKVDGEFEQEDLSPFSSDPSNTSVVSLESGSRYPPSSHTSSFSSTISLDTGEVPHHPILTISGSTIQELQEEEKKQEEQGGKEGQQEVQGEMTNHPLLHILSSTIEKIQELTIKEQKQYGPQGIENPGLRVLISDLVDTLITALYTPLVDANSEES